MELLIHVIVALASVVQDQPAVELAIRVIVALASVVQDQHVASRVKHVVLVLANVDRQVVVLANQLEPIVMLQITFVNVPQM